VVHQREVLVPDATVPNISNIQELLDAYLM
jgi:hypothetical protein